MARPSVRQHAAASGVAVIVALVGVVVLACGPVADRRDPSSPSPQPDAEASRAIVGPSPRVPPPSAAASGPIPNPSHRSEAGGNGNGVIAFVDGHSLKFAAADGTNVRTVASVADGAERLRFSPDGTRLAYRTTGPVPTIVVANADGSHPVVVASSVRIPTGPPLTWSPDGRRIAFIWGLVKDKIGTIEVIDVDGSNQRNVVAGPAAEAVDRFDPAWSPDGQWIAFFSVDAAFQVTLNVIHPDGSGEQTLKTSPMNPDIPRMAWAPDPTQERLIYVAGPLVKIYDIGTATETTVDSGFWPTWSPDGSVVTWWSEGNHLLSVADLVAGRRTSTMVFPVVPGSCHDDMDLARKAICGPAEWSPDGAWIYGFDVLGTSIVFARADGTPSTHVIALDHAVDLEELGDDGQIAWQPIVP